MKALILFIRTLVFCLAFAYSFPAKSEPMIPDFNLHTVEGEAYTLEKVIGDGRWTLIMFWAIDCSICRQQEPLMSAFHEKHKKDDAKVIGISIDGMEKKTLVKKHLARHSTSFPNYIGSLALIGFNFMSLTEESFRGTPTYLLFSPSGQLQGSNAGPMRIEALEKFIDKRG